jgi:tRNA A-37 threonylcarbamoyl transferase component Bud32
MSHTRLLAQGRATDVFAHGEHAILRRYREGEWCDVEREARLMRFLRERGYPVPAVLETGDREIVMDRLDGRTMLVELGRRPWRLRSYARVLAELHHRLHTIEAPEWLGPAVRAPGELTGDRVLHVDLHPDNVMMT